MYLRVVECRACIRRQQIATSASDTGLAFSHPAPVSFPTQEDAPRLYFPMEGAALRPHTDAGGVALEKLRLPLSETLPRKEHVSDWFPGDSACERHWLPSSLEHSRVLRSLVAAGARAANGALLPAGCPPLVLAPPLLQPSGTQRKQHLNTQDMSYRRVICLSSHKS